jgi:hypothetical protein
MDSRWGGISVGVGRTECNEVPARLFQRQAVDQIIITHVGS